MTLDEFLISIKLKADTRPAEDMSSAIDRVSDSSQNADAQVESFGSRMSKVFGSAITIVGAAAIAIKGALMGAWAFFDSYISKAEELYESKDDDLKITKEQFEMSKRYQENLDKTGKVIESIKTKIAFGFLPVMEDLSEQFMYFLDDNKELIQNGLLKVLEAIAKLGQVISNFFRFIDTAIRFTIGWEKALYLVAAAFAFVKRAMILAFITNPIAWVVAALAGLLLLIDDFMTYLDGGESEFGEYWGSMLDWVKDNEEALRDLWTTLKAIGYALVETGKFLIEYFGGALVDLVELIAGVFALIVGIFNGDTELMKAAWSGMIDSFISLFRNLAMLFQPLANAITNVLSAMVSKIGSVLSTVYDVITSPFRRAFEWIVDKFSQLPSMIGGIISKITGVSMLGNIGASIGSSAARIVNNYAGNTTASINVTSPDPQMAASGVMNGFKNLQAINNTGGAALA